MSTGTEKTPAIQGRPQDRDKAAESGYTDTRLLVPIRVLYTINSSPQFLLARQRRKVQVVPIAWRAESTEKATAPVSTESPNGCHRFARVSLKTCLGAVCTSSPELLADRSRDYSVYVLDPLESTVTENMHADSRSESLAVDSRTSDTSPSSGLLREGVSIGMGLMSWCITDDRVAVPGVDNDEDDDGCVIGKLVKDRGADALEVVIFLRETALQSQQQHALSLSSLGFYTSSTASPADHYSVKANAQCPLSVPSSPKANVLSSLPESSQSSTSSVDPYGECVPECGETSIPEAASSSTSGHAPRVGRPPGAMTNPEKRARRLAIQSHKEMLERMENIAKMQRGAGYDKTLIRISDHDIPTVTDEEIARQQKILQELESRPLIVDKSRLLTTKPLPKRAKASTSIVPLSKSTPPKRTPRSTSSTKTTASGSGQESNNAVNMSNVSTGNAVENKHGTQLLLSLLTSVLGKVDGPCATQPNILATKKGKEKETADTALAGVLRELLPFIPDAVQASALSASRATSSPASAILPGHKVDQWNGVRSQLTLSLSKAPSLFKTAEETFYSPQPGPNRPYDQHWAVNVTGSTREHPKVREDAHPVPGGGWARGRNLVPRAAISPDSMSHPPNGQIECTASDPAKCTSTPAAQARPDKENTPPTKTGRGLKRALSSAAETKEKGGILGTANDKKRKQNPAPALGNSEHAGAKRTAVGLTARDKTNTFGASGLPVAASSPSRSTASARATLGLPVMAMSEPDYLFPPPPIVATSTLPDLINEPPRTPPRHETSLDDKADDSLFTPCAPNDELTSRLRGGTHHSANGPLFSPSAVRGKSRVSHVANNPAVPGAAQECSGTESESRPVRTGWDLPPSSPPPPTSPISPHAEIGSEQDNHMDFESTLQLQTGPVEMEKGYPDGKPEDRSTTIKSGGVSTAGTDQTPGCSSDFDLLTDTDFDFSLLDQAQEGTGEIELDIEELWSSLGPVIAQAQSDSSVPANNQASSEVDVDFSYFDLGNDQTHVETEVKSGVDATKLAEDLKALFGGCVV